MKNRAVRFGVLLFGVFALSLTAVAGGKSVKNSGDIKMVDAGSFGVFMNGQRVATETFRVQQRPDYSITTSDLKLPDGSTQSSELQIFPNGDLRKYTWRAIAPEKAESVLEPGDQVLIQHVTMGTEKKHDLPYILPASTIVLDDYFFVHRELLAWRYLASGCAAGAKGCPLPKAQLGIIVPRQHTPGTVSMEYQGREKITIRGSEQEMSRFLLKNDDQEWQLWLDDQYKLIRILIASENTEIIRD